MATTMSHPTASREEWLDERLDLLEAEKALTRAGRRVAKRRQALPWVKVDKDYRFDTDEGRASLDGPVPRPLAAARLSFHVRPRLPRRLPVLLGDRRRLQRLLGASREP